MAIKLRPGKTASAGRTMAMVLLLSSSSPASSLAHVGYVVHSDEMGQNATLKLSFLLHALRDPLNLVLITGTVLLLCACYLLLRRNPTLRRTAASIQARAESYIELTPWIFRSSVGISLIVAGAAGALISPALPGFPQFSSVQMLLGFLFLCGFLLVPATLAAAALFLFALSNTPYLLGNADLLALLLALFVLGDPRPGLDDLLGIRFLPPLKSLRPFVPAILRVGIGGALMFLALYEKFLNPGLSLLVVERYHLVSLVPVSPEMWILSAGLIEFAVGLLLFLGFRTRLVLAVAFLVLALSFLYFGGEVSSHVTLFGVIFGLFASGSGRLSVDEYYASRDAAHARCAAPRLFDARGAEGIPGRAGPGRRGEGRWGISIQS